MNRKVAQGDAALPQGWRKRKLGEVCLIDNRTLPSTTPDNYRFDYISLSDIDRGRLLQTQKSFYSEAPSRARRIVAKGDVLLSTVRPNLQGFYIFRNDVKDCIVSTGFAVLSPKQDLLHPPYLYQILFSQYMLSTYQAFNVGSNYPAINSSDIREFKTVVPPLPEQKAIASLLETWDTAIEKTEALIAAKRKRFKLLIRALIGQGQSSADWNRSKLVEVGRFSKGSGITKEELAAEGIPCIRYGELYTKHNFRIQNFYSFISRKNARKYKLIQNNDLLFAGSGETRGEIGKCASFNHNTEARAGGDVIVCSIDSRKLRADFASYFLNTEGRRQINKLGQGNSIVHIYSRFLESVEVPIPALHEQETIISLLETCETEINKMEEIAEKYRIQKRGLIQKLLSGKWRVLSKNSQ